jgi:ABC-type transport system involved in multi-copper enzyme maturation permease subunit
VNLNFESSFLFASLFWGSVGAGYWIYGKRQSAMSAMLGGFGMIAVSFLVSSWLLMSLLCLAIAVAVYALVKRGH